VHKSIVRRARQRLVVHLAKRGGEDCAFPVNDAHPARWLSCRDATSQQWAEQVGADCFGAERGGG